VCCSNQLSPIVLTNHTLSLGAIVGHKSTAGASQFDFFWWSFLLPHWSAEKAEVNNIV
jgi:hypothetical protein